LMSVLMRCASIAQAVQSRGQPAGPGHQRHAALKPTPGTPLRTHGCSLPVAACTSPPHIMPDIAAWWLLRGLNLGPRHPARLTARDAPRDHAVHAVDLLDGARHLLGSRGLLGGSARPVFPHRAGALRCGRGRSLNPFRLDVVHRISTQRRLDWSPAHRESGRRTLHGPAVRSRSRRERERSITPARRASSADNERPRFGDLAERTPH